MGKRSAAQAAGAAPVASTSSAPSTSLTALVAAGEPADTELDALFKATPVARPAPARAPAAALQAAKAARSKRGPLLAPEAFLGLKRKADKPAAPPPSKRAKKVATAPPPPAAVASSDEASDADADADADEDADEDDGEDESAPIVHESLLPGFAGSKAAKGTKRARAAADDEDPAVRNARTVFVGNVPTACALTKTSRKAFSRFIANLLKPDDDEPAAGKIESMRFRGLAPAENVATRPRPDKPAEPAKLSHAAARASAFRKRGELLGPDEAPPVTPAASTGIVFQTEAQKRKTAAIKRKIHEGVSSCVAYLVLDSSAAVDALIAIAASDLAAAPFEGHVLRFDRVTGGKNRSTADVPRDEARRTAFLGGLDFAQSEQGVREWAEAQIERERGQTEDGASWVESVRLVRDRQTGMGKGFAYVLLADNDCVDELVALAPEHLKLSKRKIRVQRCASAAKLEAERALAAKAAARKTSAAANALAQQASAQPGDRRRKSSKGGPASTKVKRPPPPTLEQRAKAQKLATLAKDDRKAVKSADADRIARRIEKKRTQVVKERKVRRAMAKRVKA